MPNRALLSILPVVVLAASCAPQPEVGPPALPVDRHAYVWAMAGDSGSSDGLLVLDMDTASSAYGAVVGELLLDTTGTMTHHIERRVHDGTLFANGWVANRTWIFDLSDPVRPAIRASFSGVEGVAGWTHDVARLPNGRMLVAFNAGPGAYEGSGGMAEVDNDGTIVQVTSALMPGLDDTAATPYVIKPVAGRDRAVVGLTEMGMPGQEVYHEVGLLQLWRTDSLAPLAVIPLPADVVTLGHLWPSSIETTASGEMFVNTFSCGLFRVTGLDGDAPSAESVFTFPGNGMTLTCGVGVTVGDYWIQAVAALPGLMVIDLANPTEAREVARLVMDTTAFPGVHWVSVDGAGSRLAITGNGSWLAMATFDRATGAVAFDERFGRRDDGAPGTVMHDMAGRVVHPHGVAWGP